MRRVLALLVLAGLAVVGLTACMGDDEGSAREQRRAAALVSTAAGGAEVQLTIAGVTPIGKAIEVNSYSWGLSNPGSPTGTTGGPAQFSDLQIAKNFDEISPLLAKGAAMGNLHTNAALKLYKFDAGKPTNYATYDLTDVLISEVQQSGNAQGGAPAEQVSLKFVAVKLTSAPINPDGTLGKAEIFTWNLSTQKP